MLKKSLLVIGLMALGVTSCEVKPPFSQPKNPTSTATALPTSTPTTPAGPKVISESCHPPVLDRGLNITLLRSDWQPLKTDLTIILSDGTSTTFLVRGYTVFLWSTFPNGQVQSRVFDVSDNTTAAAGLDLPSLDAVYVIYFTGCNGEVWFLDKGILRLSTPTPTQAPKA